MTDVYDITCGVGGLWHVHKWNNSLEINTELEDGANRYVLASIEGLPSLSPAEQLTTPKVGRIGDNFTPQSARGRPVTYKGQIEADSEPELKRLGTALRAAFADRTTYGTMDVIPQVPMGDTSPTARFYAIPIGGVDIVEEITGDRFTSQFTVGLYMIDPRVYFLGLAVDVTHATAAAGTNPGNAPVDPVLHVTVGTPGTVVVTYTTPTPDRTLTFLNVPAGTLDIDFGARTAKVGSTAVELDVDNSDWWDDFVGVIDPGAFSVSQTGGTDVRVVFTPATW